MIRTNIAARRLFFSTDIAPAVEGSAVAFITVGTPSREDGGADLSAVDDVARHRTEYVGLHSHRREVHRPCGDMRSYPPDSHGRATRREQPCPSTWSRTSSSGGQRSRTSSTPTG